jgi:hypothetical protein
MPVCERDLAAGRSGVENANTPGFDQIDAVVLRTLVEQGLATIEHLAATMLENGSTLEQRQSLEQRRRAAE